MLNIIYFQNAAPKVTSVVCYTLYLVREHNGAVLRDKLWVYAFEQNVSCFQDAASNLLLLSVIHCIIERTQWHRPSLPLVNTESVRAVTPLHLHFETPLCLHVVIHGLCSALEFAKREKRVEDC